MISLATHLFLGRRIAVATSSADWGATSGVASGIEASAMLGGGCRSGAKVLRWRCSCGLVDVLFVERLVPQAGMDEADEGV